MSQPKTAEAVTATAADQVREVREPDPDRITDSAYEAAAALHSSLGKAAEEIVSHVKAGESVEDRALAFRKRLAAWLLTIKAPECYKPYFEVDDFEVDDCGDDIGDDDDTDPVVDHVDDDDNDTDNDADGDSLDELKAAYLDGAKRTAVHKAIGDIFLPKADAVDARAHAAEPDPEDCADPEDVDADETNADAETDSEETDIDQLINPPDGEEDDEALPADLTDSARSAGGCAMSVRARVDEREEAVEKWRERSNGCALGLDAAEVLVQLEGDYGDLENIAAISVSGPVGTLERLAEHVESAVRKFVDARGPNTIEDSIGRKVDREPPADRDDGYELVEITITAAPGYSVNAGGVDLQEESIVFIGELGAAEKLTEAFRSLAANRCKRWAAAMRAKPKPKPKANGNGSGQHVERAAEPVAV